METKYLVIELQTNEQGVVSNIVTSHNTYLDAQNKYHLVLAAASVSSVPLHGACILTNSGVLEESRVYGHQSEEPD